jgi:Cu/Zn superoxide dismutase
MKIPKLLIASAILSLVSASSFAAEEATPQKAIAVLHATAGQHCHGVVRFTQEGDSVKVVADLEGLNPGQKHAFHIHQYGDCSAPDATSAGSHYNPEGHQHGLTTTAKPIMKLPSRIFPSWVRRTPFSAAE